MANKIIIENDWEVKDSINNTLVQEYTNEDISQDEELFGTVLTTQQYNEIPLYYCKQCLSLGIISTEEGGVDYCNDCLSTDIGIADISTWENLYKKKYNSNLKKGNKHGREEDRREERK